MSSPLALSAHADSAKLLNDSSGELVIEVSGDDSGAAAEIYHDMEAQASEWSNPVSIVFLDPQTLLIDKELRAFKSPTAPHFRVQIETHGGGVFAEQSFANQLHTGRLAIDSTGLAPLLQLLRGDDDSYERFNVKAGTFVRCMNPSLQDADPQCWISLTDPLDHPLPPTGCAAYVESVAAVVHGPNWGDGELATLFVRIRPDLVDKVSSVQFKPTVAPDMNDFDKPRFALVPGQTDIYQINLTTVQNLHGGLQTPIVNEGYILVRMKDRSSFFISPEERAGAAYKIDSDFVRKIPSANRIEGAEDRDLPLINTARLTATADGTPLGRSLNPQQCQTRH